MRGAVLYDDAKQLLGLYIKMCHMALEMTDSITNLKFFSQLDMSSAMEVDIKQQKISRAYRLSSVHTCSCVHLPGEIAICLTQHSANPSIRGEEIALSPLLAAEPQSEIFAHPRHPHARMHGHTHTDLCCCLGVF